MSAKEYLYGRKRRPSKGQEGTRTALYLRVSTPDQKPDLQFDGLHAYAARAGLDIVQDYCDVGVSGRREGRPQLNALMTAARNREIDCVLVWKFDRFARSTRHLLAALEEFNHLGVRFVSVPQGGARLDSLSYPSGHSSGIATLVTVALVLAWPLMAARARHLALAAGVLLVLLVGLTRMWLGVHFLSDVVGGWALGVAWTLLTALLFGAFAEGRASLRPQE